MDDSILLVMAVGLMLVPLVVGATAKTLEDILESQKPVYKHVGFGAYIAISLLAFVAGLIMMSTDYASFGLPLTGAAGVGLLIFMLITIGSIRKECDSRVAAKQVELEAARRDPKYVCGRAKAIIDSMAKEKAVAEIRKRPSTYEEIEVVEDLISRTKRLMAELLIDPTNQRSYIEGFERAQTLDEELEVCGNFFTWSLWALQPDMVHPNFNPDDWESRN